MSESNRFTLREWQRLFKNQRALIVQASMKDGSDSWQQFPIGMSWQYILNAHKGPTLQIGDHERLVISAVNPATDKRRRGNDIINRQNIVNTLNKNLIPNVVIRHEEYFELLPRYKFVISPEGNGIDCHRHYEALLAGCIPIMEHNELIEKKYEGCPILYTRDYSEITEEYLNKKYDEMLDTKYDFSRLFLSYYDDATVFKIKDCGNYWCRRTTGVIWY